MARTRDLLRKRKKLINEHTEATYKIRCIEYELEKIRENLIKNGRIKKNPRLD